MSQKCRVFSTFWVLCIVLPVLASGCNQTSSVQAVAVVATRPLSESPSFSQDYSQPEAVADLFYQLILTNKWNDAYSLLTKDSKDSTKLGDFIQAWAAEESRTKLVKAERIGQPVIDEGGAHLYYEASYDQAYPKPGSFKTYSARSLVNEDGAWRLRWRPPQNQTDLGQELIIDQSQEQNDIVTTLDRVILLERATLVFFTLLNHSSHAAQFDPDSAQLVLTDGHAIPLETVTVSKLGPRTLEAGQERQDVLFFRALEPAVTEATFVSPQVVQGGDTQHWRFSFQID